MEHNSTFPIKINELVDLRDEASSYLKSVQWEQGNRAKNKDKSSKEQESILLYLSKATGSSAVGVISVSKTILKLKKILMPNSLAIPLKLNKALLNIQEAIAIGIWLKDNYNNSSGFSALNERKSILDNEQKREFESKMQTSTAYMLFGFAYYTLFELKDEASDDLSIMKNKFAGIPELSFASPLKGISCALFYYDKYLNHPDVIKTEQDIIDFTVVYFEALIDEIIHRKGSLDYTDTLEDRTYKLEKSEFAVSGWNTEFNDNRI